MVQGSSWDFTLANYDAVWAFLVQFGLLLLFLMLRSRYRDIIRDLAQTQVKNTTSDLTNDAIARQIAEGDIEATPYRTGREDTPCRFCDYKEACHFDPTMKKDKLRFLPVETEKLLASVQSVFPEAVHDYIGVLLYEV